MYRYTVTTMGASISPIIIQFLIWLSVDVIAAKEIQMSEEEFLQEMDRIDGGLAIQSRLELALDNASFSFLDDQMCSNPEEKAALR